CACAADRVSGSDAGGNRNDPRYRFSRLADAALVRILCQYSAAAPAPDPRPFAAFLHHHRAALRRGPFRRRPGQLAARALPEKLDIKFIVEPDDVETSVVLARLKLRTPFEIITAPWSGPRTKPKALNAALPFALGTFIVVYDAEDRPEPDQLQRSVEAFQT